MQFSFPVYVTDDDDVNDALLLYSCARELLYFRVRKFSKHTDDSWINDFRIYFHSVSLSVPSFISLLKSCWRRSILKFRDIKKENWVRKWNFLILIPFRIRKMLQKQKKKQRNQMKIFMNYSVNSITIIPRE